MNDESKLPLSVGFASLSGFAAGWDWVVNHVTLAGLIAVCAGAFSMWASWETIKARRAERKRWENPYE